MKEEEARRARKIEEEARMAETLLPESEVRVPESVVLFLTQTNNFGMLTVPTG